MSHIYTSFCCVVVIVFLSSTCGGFVKLHHLVVYGYDVLWPHILFIFHLPYPRFVVFSLFETWRFFQEVYGFVVFNIWCFLRLAIRIVLTITSWTHLRFSKSGRLTLEASGLVVSDCSVFVSGSNGSGNSSQLHHFALVKWWWGCLFPFKCRLAPRGV